MVFWVAVALVLLPLVASAVHVLGEGNFHNLGDTAGIEMRTRDVGHHVVLLGLWSRSDWNHPGPALFYLLALPYRLAGSNPSGLQLGALLINGAAVLGMAVVARRRGGLALSVFTLLGCGILLHALKPAFWGDVWNPFMPVLPFGVLVLLCWSIACDDVWAMPIAAGVASFCIQTHVGYAALTVPFLREAQCWCWRSGRRQGPRARRSPQPSAPGRRPRTTVDARARCLQARVARAARAQTTSAASSVRRQCRRVLAAHPIWHDAELAALPPGHGDVIVRTKDLSAIMHQGVQLALEEQGIPARR